ncbi:phage tail protein [Anaeromassilibacillus senegalensis]|uniref:Phage tail protein n=1 Tax=Anaeromassilibacillus senegalensis TaxID=1673717 RepID=A0ABS9CL57_9FIRM|nr:phage tail protein [Anaeromassilibacillus senegalensis]MCF2651875.1 phage tail protein [Anaeromassilibacillus senegalensis]
MYRITCDNQVIHDPRSNNLLLISPKAVLGVGVAGTMSFKMAPSHPLYKLPKNKKSVLRFYQDGELLWQGFIRKINRDRRNIKTIDAAGELAYLNDSVQPYTVYHDVSLRNYLQALLDVHNAQMDEDKRFVLGNVTVTDPNDSLYRYSTNQSTYKTLEDRLLKRLGGYLVVRYGADGTRYLDYLKEYGRICGQKIAYGKNLLDFAVSTPSDDVATVVMPLGAKLNDADGNPTEERLTIAAANNGSVFLEDAEAIETYRRIVKTVIHDDITLVENLVRAGYADLEAAKHAVSTFKLRAVDLSLCNVNVDKIRVGDLLGVDSAPHGMDDYIAVSERSYDITAPENDGIVLDKAYKGLVDTQRSESEALRVEINETHARVNTVTQKVESYKTDVKKDVDNLSASVTETQKTITTTTENIMDAIEGLREESVSQTQLEEVKSAVVKLSSDNMELRFQQVKSLIDQLGGTVEDNQRLLEQYIRFEGARMSLGRSDSEITAVLSNDKLAFVENGQEVAYISNRTLYITDVHILQRLTFGDVDHGLYSLSFGETNTLDFGYEGDD